MLRDGRLLGYSYERMVSFGSKAITGHREKVLNRTNAKYSRHAYRYISLSLSHRSFHDRGIRSVVRIRGHRQRFNAIPCKFVCGQVYMVPRPSVSFSPGLVFASRLPLARSTQSKRERIKVYTCVCPARIYTYAQPNEIYAYCRIYVYT